MSHQIEDAKRLIQAAAEGLIDHATKLGLVVTIETASRQPLAMGHYAMVVTTREARHPAPAPVRGRYEAVKEMAYLLNLAPRGEVVAVEALNVLGKHYDAALLAAGGAAPAGLVSARAYDRQHEHAETLAARVLELEDRVATDPIRGLVQAHKALIESGENYAYFELACTRQTGWMAWLTDRPGRGEPGTAEYAKSRKVIARGQGDSAEEACQDALDLLATTKGGSHG